jgi:hypothetical protein
VVRQAVSAAKRRDLAMLSRLAARTFGGPRTEAIASDPVGDASLSGRAARAEEEVIGFRIHRGE